MHSAIADTFRSGAGAISAVQTGEDSVSVTFSNAVAGLEGLFDQLAITRKGTPPGTVVLGPFLVSESRSGQYVLLRRNPHYWKTDEAGRRLPYLDSVRLAFRANGTSELLRFRRGEFQLVDKLDPDLFQQLRKDRAGLAVSAGPGLDPEFLWFNQSPAARIPAHKRAWFSSVRFRQAISKAVNRDDVVRLVYLGRARTARGPISEANIRWFDSRLPVPVHDPSAARALLKQDGFTLSGGALRDRAGNPVEFSLITNAGSKTRSQIGAIVQEDLARIGIRLNLVPLEFQSLVERITRTQEYEACLLGLSNTELDPRTQINVFSSSGTHHAWNPGQPQPSTVWEKELDGLLAGP